MPWKKLQHNAAPIAAGITVAGAFFSAGIIWSSVRSEVHSIYEQTEKIPEMEKRIELLQEQLYYLNNKRNDSASCIYQSNEESA